MSLHDAPPAPREVPLNEYRSNVLIGNRPIGYIVRMFDFTGIAIDVRTGNKVSYFASPALGGLARAYALNLATSDTKAGAIANLVKMDSGS